MRIAILFDIHGNLAALEAVIAGLRHTAPDVVLHGGDLADGGAHPVEVVDRIRDMGVADNTDEMLFRPEPLREFVCDSPRWKTCSRQSKRLPQPRVIGLARSGSHGCEVCREFIWRNPPH